MSERERGSGTHCRSALFVDFDNVFIGLEEQESGLGKTFAEQPSQWIDWLEQSVPLADGELGAGGRRILVRRCYLNPTSFGRYRPFLVRAGFQTIDCPVLTSNGKTSADVQMVVDMLDFLDHETNFDEFIVMSADADFRPVLIRLREHDRRTVVLATGPASAAYKSACDVLISQDDFVAQFSDSEPAVSEAASVVVSPPSASKHLTKKTKAELSARIRGIVEESTDMVPMASLAQKLKASEGKLGDTWGGYGSFTALIDNLDIKPYVRSDAPPGHVYDPDRHSPPTTATTPSNPAFLSESEAMTELATKVYRITDTPYLTSGQYGDLFKLLAEEINTNGYHLTQVSKAVRDSCRAADIPVGRQHINFIMRGIAFTGYRFGRQDESADALAQQLYKNTISLCSRAQLDLSEEEERLVSVWITGAESSG